MLGSELRARLERTRTAMSGTDLSRLGENDPTLTELVLRDDLGLLHQHVLRERKHLVVERVPQRAQRVDDGRSLILA